MRTTICILACLLFCITISAQIQLSFAGTPILTGTAGTVGAQYTYANAGTTGSITIKAVVAITGMTSAGLDNIDGPASNGGTDNAFQPVVYGSQTTNNCWNIQFRISFYDASNNNPLTLSSFRASGIDIDGNGSNLREHNTFVQPQSYVVENPNNLTITPTGNVYQFRGPVTSYAGISLTQTNVAVTCLFTNRQFVDIYIGACCQTSNCSVAAGSGRQHSINFFDAVAYGAPMTTLPVELLSFTAARTNTGVSLNWRTAAEINLSSFAVERSEGRGGYTQIGMMPAQGDNSQYAFSDNRPLNGPVYYRLRAVDIDGRFTYSPVAVVNGTVDRTRITGVSPNPVGQQFNLSLESGRTQNLGIQIFNNSGQLLFSQARMVVRGTNVLSLEMKRKLSAGVYLLKTTTEEGSVENTKPIAR